MGMVKLDKIPAGAPVIVAIMTHSGYNQEDSLLFNQGSIDRGLFKQLFIIQKKMKIRKLMVMKKLDVNQTRKDKGYEIWKL